MPHHDALDEEYRPLYEAANALAESPEFYSAFTELARDPDRFAKAAETGSEMLGEFGISLPDGLNVDFFEGHEGKPDPDQWTAFSVVLSNCRTVKKVNREKRTIEEATICLSVRIVPNPVPGGPWG